MAELIGGDARRKKGLAWAIVKELIGKIDDSLDIRDSYDAINAQSNGIATYVKAYLDEIVDTLEDLIVASTYTKEIIIVDDEKSQGTQGGASSTGFNDRVLNTTRVNTITGASLSSNQITLPVGNYRIDAVAPVYYDSVTATMRTSYLDFCKSDNTIVVKGQNFILYDLDVVYPCRLILLNKVSGYFTATVETAYKLRHYISFGVASIGLGMAVNASGRAEVYSHIEIEKIP